MSLASRTGRRPVSVYVTAQLIGIVLAAGVAWLLWTVGVPPWLAIGCWLGLSAYLSRKRLPTEVLGSALYVGALLALGVPVAPVLEAVLEGRDLSAIDVATSLFGPALSVVVIAGGAFVAGRLLKRHARQRLGRRERHRIGR